MIKPEQEMGAYELILNREIDILLKPDLVYVFMLVNEKLYK